jgi:hypothetical protein
MDSPVTCPITWLIYPNAMITIVIPYFTYIHMLPWYLLFGFRPGTAHSTPIHMTLLVRHIHWRRSRVAHRWMTNYLMLGTFAGSSHMLLTVGTNMTPLPAWWSDPVLEGTPLFCQINIYSYIVVWVLYVKYHPCFTWVEFTWSTQQPHSQLSS